MEKIVGERNLQVQESIELSASTVEERAENENDESYEFPEIDNISWYTLRIYVIISLPLLVSAGFTLSYAFTTGTISYRCFVPECEDLTDTIIYPSWLSSAVPYENDKPASCTRFTVLNVTDSCSTTVFTEGIERCDSWVYDTDERTILNEWDLTCDNNQWMLTLPGTVNNVGQFVGLIFTGYFSDKYGRRNVLAFLSVACGICGVIQAMSVNYAMFVTFEFLTAVFGAGIYSAGFILGMELVGPKSRVLISNVICCMYSSGAALLALSAMWLRNWRFVLVSFYAPALLAIFVTCLVPESVRWLLGKGRVAEAEKVLYKIAAEKGIQVSPKSIDVIKNLGEKKNETKTKRSKLAVTTPVREVLKNRKLLTRLVVCAFCWIANVFVYYGLSLHSVAVSGDKFINFIFVSLVEIPAQLFSWILVEHVGRKPTLTGSFFLGGLFCILTPFVPEDLWYVPLIVFLGGKFCITVAFCTLYVFTAEFFPTPVRHSLLGLCSMTARVGSMVAPQMPLLANLMPSLPLLLFGGTSIIAGGLSLGFPETMGIELPETVHAAVNIGT
ncbi:solute carrier family 22 member 21-like isoform X2 [Athalia rosae]|uniref:solute carrier family 22 member 21-like isoform X2 n=1 Tax=Athalia rosae TaxID=37344 RepID=UPI00203472CD|nr:solute carrier family 22 member 21-like isoform X2 [Athalia rosae]